MKCFKIYSGTFEGKPFIFIPYDNFGDERVTDRLKTGLDPGLDKFFKAIIRELKLEDKRKKEEDFGYLSLVGGSSKGGGD